MKTIGLMGGMGWQGSAAYYRVMNNEVRAQLGGWSSARIILDSLDFKDIAQAQSTEEFRSVRSTLVASARRLEGAGAEVLVIACNTVHRFAQAVSDAVSIPLLHIAAVAGDVLTRDRHSRVGLLGTRATMQGSFYRQHLADREIEVLTPAPAMQRRIHDLVVHELATGVRSTNWSETLDEAVAALHDEGCTGVLLACTEFGLVYGATDSPVIERQVPLYDTAVLHARAAVDRALS